MKLKKSLIIIVGIAAIIYGGFLIKKSIYDKGYPSESDEKEIFLGYYVISKGLPNTKQNRNKYRSMTLQQLKKELGITDTVVE
jgi:hypothetical protein